MRLTAWLTEAAFAASVLFLARFVSCSTVENCAIWAVHCELSLGCIGCWCCSCATSSLRNVSLSSAVAGFLAAALEVDEVLVVPTGLTVAIAIAPLGVDVDERPGGELDGARRGGHGGGLLVAVGVAALGGVRTRGAWAALGAAVVMR